MLLKLHLLIFYNSKLHILTFCNTRNLTSILFCSKHKNRSVSTIPKTIRATFHTHGLIIVKLAYSYFMLKKTHFSSLSDIMLPMQLDIAFLLQKLQSFVSTTPHWFLLYYFQFCSHIAHCLSLSPLLSWRFCLQTVLSDQYSKSGENMSNTAESHKAQSAPAK